MGSKKVTSEILINFRRDKQNIFNKPGLWDEFVGRETGSFDIAIGRVIK